MQAIITKYHGPTNTRGSRIIGKAGNVTVTCDPNDSRRMHHEDIHAECAKQVAAKLGWSGEWAACQVDRVGWVWVPCDDRNVDRFSILKGGE